ncbi:hypothetical protein [Comamonas sp.]|uniref:hypothetical protein n=1 Tax=Comamonas sp. TaxID=34028 RepID=UPI0028A9BCCB|nr:hypothetical protein [Comamonas sp.]
MLGAFQDMAIGILDLIGEDAFFAGSLTPTKINIEHGVQLAGIGGDEAVYKGDMAVNRDVATVLSSLGPKATDTFVQNGRTYRLEFLVEDNGVTRRFAIMEV